MRAWCAWALLAASSACGGVPPDRGLDARLGVADAAYVEGAMPESAGGPAVESIDLPKSDVSAGDAGIVLRAALGSRATAALVGLEGDLGYWIVPAGLADVSAPTFPTIDVRLSLASSIPPGAASLVLRAVDAEGRPGPSTSRALRVSAPAVPSGALVVSLRWDSDADLDLHVVDALGREIWKGDIETPAPDAASLDLDSNAGCVGDGRRRESVTWAARPRAGRYVVKVDTFSLCAAGAASWRVEAWLDGAVVARATGVSGLVDTTFVHGRGAGVLALEIDVP
ncbi:MAG: hypothetical protein IT374_01955 [Polyangiaceae bacterium]|nr:hypothetical protein [Polyangiaceae bacterium]